MKTLSLSCAVAVFSLCLAVPAQGEIILAPELIVKAVSEGRKGAWFSSESYRLVLKHELQLEKTIQKLSIADKEIASLRREREAFKIQLANSKKKVDLFQAQYHDERDVRLSVETELNAWYRSPVLWGSLGAVIGAVVGSVLVAVLMRD